MGDYFNFFPDHGIIFIDTCALGAGYEYEEDRTRRIERIKDEIMARRSKINTLRTSYLIEKLSNVDNWFVTREVIEEFEFGVMRFKELFKRIISGKLSAVMREEITQRETLLELLKQNYENPPIDLSCRMAEKNSLLSKIEEIFTKNGQKIDARNTDCRIIFAALVCAEMEQAYMLSIDRPLLRTYSSCSVEFGLQLKGTYILDEQKGSIISTQQYWLDNC